MNINGSTMIFKNEYGYSTSISNKNKEGQYESMYVTVQLPKGTELENKTKVNITKGFISFFSTKNGQKLIKIVILDFDLINNNKSNDNNDIEEDSTFLDSLPF